MSPNLEFPARYEPLSRLGTGGGGEVWAVADCHSNARFALKVLAVEATGDEMAALVREALALSGLEGLGVPRVRQFGRLPHSKRAYMVRDLVEGSSLQHLIDDRVKLSVVLSALAQAAEQLTLVHRAGFFHGDIKPANIIVGEDGRATLVDLGLAAPWRDVGTTPKGLTPKYAAPELLTGGPLTVRCEVYALGAALAEAVRLCSLSESASRVLEVQAVAERARDAEQSARYPSADEFAAALRQAARLARETEAPEPSALWPIVGIEATASRLIGQVTALGAGDGLVIEGAKRSGKSVLLRRLAWSLGVEGRGLVWIDDSMVDSPHAIEAEITSRADEGLDFVLVDDAAKLKPESVELLRRACQDGARVVLVCDREVAKRQLGAFLSFAVPPLGEHAALELVRRAIPSLTEPVARRLIEQSRGRPGELRLLVQRIAAAAVVSEEDVEQLTSELGSSPSVIPSDPLAQVVHYLDRGRYNEARSALERVAGQSGLDVVVARARLEAALDEAQAALNLLEAARPEAEQQIGSRSWRNWSLWLGRAQYGLGEYAQAVALLESLSSGNDAIAWEARVYQGLAYSHLREIDLAEQNLTAAAEQAQLAGEHRVAGLALVSLGFVLQRSDRTEQAREVYRRAIAEAQVAGDAGTLGTGQLNLATLLKASGDLAGALEHFEAAVDMGRRSGRRVTLRSALMNLANLDLYLGRVARARASIEALEQQRQHLPPTAEAQLLGLGAELALASGDLEAAGTGYRGCADAFALLGRGVDAAEARLEGVLLASRATEPDSEALRRAIVQATAELGDAPAHRALLMLATARAKWVGGDEAAARDCLDAALEAARQAQRKDLMWRVLEARAELEATSGQPLLARRDREEALSVLESIAARLPRDLREVFWNDSRRRSLRSTVESLLGLAPTDLRGRALGAASSHSSSAVSEISRTPLEQGLARILEVNSELLGELDLERLTRRVVEYAVELLKGERGFLLLREPDGKLVVHTARTRYGDQAHAEFSRSIAEQVIRSRQPMVSLNAKNDTRMQSYASVHELMLETVVCVPIEARGGEPLGALYVEARQRLGHRMENDVPTLRAFAAQVTLALETTGLLAENRARANELERSNEALRDARSRLEELLGDRTKQLKLARQKLRMARHTLYGHFGYQGLVGTSAAMRRVYALMDRLKDTDVSVLITGESGTGKEVAARAVHQASERGKRPLLAVNCGALPEQLLESELFGHVRGAFTGADRERKGLIQEASGGSLLLDEIGEMSPRMQSSLLRVLQEKRVRPVGGSREEPIDVRFFFATHRDLETMVKAGTFREDLYYRVHVIELNLPPLRDRLEDLPALVDHFLGLYAARYKRDRKTLSRAALERLWNSAWPGNVRQLEHVLLNAWILSDGNEIEVEDLGLPALTANGRGDGAGASGPPSSSRPPKEAKTGSAERAAAGKAATVSRHRRDERQSILDALNASNWNRVKAAELMGLPRRTFYRRLRQYNIQ